MSGCPIQFPLKVEWNLGIDGKGKRKKTNFYTCEYRQSTRLVHRLKNVLAEWEMEVSFNAAAFLF